MTLPLLSRVILTQDIRTHNVIAGDMGTIVEHHPATNEYPEGYEVECFAGNGETSKDVMHVRQLTPSSH